MAYLFYFGNVLLPVAPSKLEISISNKNKSMTVMNDSEINILKSPGLSSVSFDVLLPQVKYPFATYPNGKFKKANYYLEVFKKLKTNKTPFQFIVCRKFENEKPLFATNMRVAIEDYKIKEDAGNGYDLTVSIKLKQYREFGTKLVQIQKKSGKQVIKKKSTAASRSKPATGQVVYTVKRGDCLWNIAKKYYGDGTKWKKILAANKAKIKNPPWIYAGQVFVIPDAKK